MGAVTELKNIIDLERHPLDSPDSDAYRESLGAARAGLRSHGCAVVPGLITGDALERMRLEARSMLHTTHYSTTDMNPYFSPPDPALPADHPVNTMLERSSGFVPADSFAADSEIGLLYRSSELIHFVAEALLVDTVHCFADPLACLTINVLGPGQQFCWHYDTNDFAVTLLLDEADKGGRFEYITDIRGEAHENYEAVSEALNDNHPDVVALDLSPGDLQIFRGRNSLHRVTRVGQGSRPRLAAIFAYTLEAGVIGRLERTHQLFGRALAVHEQAERQRVRADSLRD